MQPKTFNEQDWKLFREKVPTWQEKYMEKINQKIQKLLENPSKTASEKFWQIEKIIHNEKRNPGVLIEMKRSLMFTNILSLLKSKCITIDDLSDFSEDLQKNVKRIWEDE